MFVNVFGQAPETWDDDQSGVLCLRNPIIGGRVQQATILHHAQTRLWHLWSDFITWWTICAELDWTRIVSLETTRRANWKEFVGIGRQCAFPEIWLETLSSFKFSLETFGSLWLLSITHHPQYENFRQHKRFLNFFSLFARLAGQWTLIGTGQCLVTSPFVQRGSFSCSLDQEMSWKSLKSSPLDDFYIVFSHLG